MSTYQTEEEQVEALKKWWAENGRSVVAGAILGLGALFGWKGWVNYQHKQAETASVHYSEVSLAFDGGDMQGVADKTRVLQDSFASSPYASLAALSLAKLKAEADDLDAAAEQLRWVIDNSPQAATRDIAALRLARTYIAQNKFDEALQLIEGESAVGYESLREEIRGDALAAKGDIPAARAAYDRALLTGANSEYLRMKRDDLGNELGENTPASSS